MKKVCAVLFVICLIGGLAAASTALAGDYNFIAPKDLQERLDKGTAPLIVDICPAQQYAAGHVKGSIETNAYPVKTEEEKARLAKELPKLQASDNDIVVVCPKGGGGAKRAVDYYKSSGVKEERLLILEGGMTGWPYETESN